MQGRPRQLKLPLRLCQLIGQLFRPLEDIRSIVSNFALLNRPFPANTRLQNSLILDGREIISGLNSIAPVSFQRFLHPSPERYASEFHKR